jgi:hypothetical protein
MRILIAEDDEALARFLRQGLEAEHYSVDVLPDEVSRGRNGARFQGEVRHKSELFEFPSAANLRGQFLHDC